MSSIKYMLVAVLITITGGCGYMTASLLPEGLNSIYVENFSNAIDPTREVSDRRSSYSYRPGLEVDVTRAVVDEFIFDGNLQIDNAERSDLLLKGELKDFRQFPLSYDDGDNVEALRMEIQVDVELYDNATDKVMWSEKNFMGQTSYTITGPNSKTESEALRMAVKDIAQRIVERTVEAW